MATSVLARVLVFLPLGAVGCSLLALDNYDITPCNAASAGVADPCKALCSDGSCVGCVSYQCNEATHHCEHGTLDADGDGDPPIACGGSDCKDGDPRVSGRKMETCDGIDNNCDGLVDEDVVASFAPRQLAFALGISRTSVVRDDSFLEVIVSSVAEPPGAPRCISVASDAEHTSAGGCLAFPVDVGVPTEPYSRPLDTELEPLVATAYARTDICDGLAFRTTRGGAIDPTCADGPGTLPSFMSGYDFADLVVTDYAAPVLAICDDAKPSTLLFRWLHGANTLTPTMDAPFVLSTNSASIRPAALAASRLLEQIVIAAPDETNGIAIWISPVFTVNANTDPPLPLSIAPTFLGARSVDVAVATVSGDTADTTDIAYALVAEIGCPPNQDVRVALGRVVLANGVLTATIDHDLRMTVPGGKTLTASPSVAWEDVTYGEWRVTWIVDGDVYLQRVSADGRMVGAPIVVSSPRPGVDARAVAAAYGFVSNVVVAPEPTMTGNPTISSETVGCP